MKRKVAKQDVFLDALQQRTHNRRISLKKINPEGNILVFERPTWKGETLEDLTAFSFIRGGRVRETAINLSDEALENLRDAITVYLREVLKK